VAVHSKEVGSSLTVAVHSEGGGVKVDSGSITRTRSLRKRTVVARSEAGVEAVTCSEVGIKDGRCLRWCGGF
jgi:hypothetical protein